MEAQPARLGGVLIFFWRGPAGLGHVLFFSRVAGRAGWCTNLFFAVQILVHDPFDENPLCRVLIFRCRGWAEPCTNFFFAGPARPGRVLIFFWAGAAQLGRVLIYFSRGPAGPSRVLIYFSAAKN